MTVPTRAPDRVAPAHAPVDGPAGDHADAFLHEHGGDLPADLPPDLRLVALVAHAREVASEEREAFGDAAAAIAQDPRAILLRTCHRVELYLTGSATSGPDALALPALPAGGLHLEGTAAARHLFRVAAGLDSVVVGEDQVLHQLRECVSERRLPAAAACPVDIGSDGPQAAGLEPLLERLFQVALHLGRETRSWREGAPRSLGDVALDRILPVTGPIADRRLLVVGAGRMARLSAIAASKQGARVLISNRGAERGTALAHDAGGELVPFGPDAELPEVDAVILAISAPWPHLRHRRGGARRGLDPGRRPVVAAGDRPPRCATGSARGTPPSTTSPAATAARSAPASTGATAAPSTRPSPASRTGSAPGRPCR